MTSSIRLLLAILLTATSAAVQLNIDLVVIIHLEAQNWLVELTSVKTAVMDKFPRSFELGPDKSRVAMVYNGKKDSGEDREWKSTPLCENKDEMTSHFGPIERFESKETHDKSLGNAYMKAREIFDKQQSRKIRVILVVSYPEYKPLEFTKEEKDIFKETRKRGIQTHVIYQRKDGKEPNRTSVYMPAAGNGWTRGTPLFESTFTSTGPKIYFEEFKKKVVAAYCKYVEECFYLDAARQQCKKAPYYPNMPVGDENDCASLKPLPQATNAECNTTECDRVCDDLGSVAKCGPDDCGKTMTSTTAPIRWKQLEHCNPERNCPECPTNPPNPPTKEKEDTPEAPEETGDSGFARAQVEVGLIIAALVITMIGGC